MRRSCTCGGMVFQTLPGARSVMPMRSRAEGATSGWMYMRKRPLVGAPLLAQFERLRLVPRDEPVRMVDLGRDAS